MGIDPADLHRMSKLSADKLNEWLVGQVPQSPFHQAAEKELARRESRTNWIKWGILAGIAAIGLIATLYKLFSS